MDSNTPFLREKATHKGFSPHFAWEKSSAFGFRPNEHSLIKT